ncbi:serine acetyltransferase [Mediterraneibacter gnavus]|uniref:serine acetyltransferase n=1 Tax=Mediterraneibacter gnavus TaxID=33038 RepID=UPI0035695411
MIKTKDDLKEYIKSDQSARSPYISGKLNRILMKDVDIYIFKYLKLLRKQEYFLNQERTLKNKIMYYYYTRKKNKVGMKLQFNIPPNVFDEGLVLNHHGTLIINAGAKVGKNCILHGNNCIGNDGKEQRAPIIGDNVDIGVNASVIGDVYLADGIVVGANSVVTKSFREKNIVIAGVPAKKIH